MVFHHFLRGQSFLLNQLRLGAYLWLLSRNPQLDAKPVASEDLEKKVQLKWEAVTGDQYLLCSQSAQTVWIQKELL